MTRLAVFVCGPLWWGDRSMAVDGTPARIEILAVRAARRDEAFAELRAVNEAIAALPEGCIVIHTGVRGASARFALAASARGLQTMVVPPGTEVDVMVGLDEVGWRLKVITVSGGVDDGVIRYLEREAGFFVRRIDRWVPEPEEDESIPQGS